MRKFFGIAVIGISLLWGLCCAVYSPDDLLFANIMFWVMGVPLFIFGQIIRTSKAAFKKQGKRWVGIYVFFFCIVPFIFYFYEFYYDLKETVFIDEQFIIYEPSSGMLGDLSLGGLLILLGLVGARFLKPDLKRKGLLNGAIFSSALLLIGFNYLMFSDYRGVHEDNGLISSNWQGNVKQISFKEMERIELKPDIHYASLSNTSDETRFVWELIFHPIHEEAVVYYYSMLTETGLEETAAIKKLALEKNIPFQVAQMNPKTLEMFDFDLKWEKLEKKRYYELFEVRD